MALENTHYGAARIADMLRDCKSIFFVGIGGINLSSLAHVTHERGYRVGGSDRVRTAIVNRLATEGIAIFDGHAAEHIHGYDALVYTVAVGTDNPEYCEAQRRGIPCISRSDYLGYLMTEYRVRVGISGTHGKSTCTSMCAEILLRAGCEPTVLSGAELALMGGAYHVGGNDLCVFEACEYMDSFLDFNPTVAVVLNVELDHVDYFADLSQMRTSFGRFMARTGQGGLAVLNADDAETMRAAADFGGELLTFGIENETARVRATGVHTQNGKYAFGIEIDGEPLCEVVLAVSGYHNIYNALAAAAVCHRYGLSGEEIAAGLAAFGGARRRMEYRGTCRGAALYDDYAHHPTEIRATLSGARKLTEGRLFCVFQSHTYSRTYALLDDFSAALRLADRVLVTDIYAARETDTKGLTPAVFANRIGDCAMPVGDFRTAAEVLEKELRAGDVAVIMGAGDVYKVFDYLGECHGM